MGPIAPIGTTYRPVDTAPIGISKDDVIPIAKPKGIFAIHSRDVVYPCPKSYDLLSLQLTSRQASIAKDETETEAKKPSVGQAIANWFTSLWNSFLNLIGLGKSEDRYAIDDIEAGNMPYLTDPNSEAYAHMQDLVRVMQALASNPEKVDDNSKEEVDTAGLSSHQERVKSLMHELIHALLRQKDSHEESLTIGHAAILRHKKEKNGFKEEFNEISDKYIKNNKWVKGANWTNIGFVIANSLIFAASLLTAALTAGTSALVGTVLFSLNTAAAIGSGATGMIRGITQAQSNKYTGDKSENLYYLDATQEKIEQTIQQDMNSDINAVAKVCEDLTRASKNERQVVKAMSV